MTTASSTTQVTFSIYNSVRTDFCDTDWWQLNASLELTAQKRGNVWSGTSTAGLPTGLYGFVTFAYYSSDLGQVGVPMCDVFRVVVPVPEFGAVGIVAILTIAVSLFVLRRITQRENPKRS